MGDYPIVIIEPLNWVPNSRLKGDDCINTSGRWSTSATYIDKTNLFQTGTDVEILLSFKDPNMECIAGANRKICELVKYVADSTNGLMK